MCAFPGAGAGSPIPLERGIWVLETVLGARVLVLPLRRASGTAGLGAAYVAPKPSPEEREWGMALPLIPGCDWGQAGRLPRGQGQLGVAVMRVMVNWVNYIHVARNTVNYVNSSIWGNYIFINWS